MKGNQSLIPLKQIDSLILWIRGQKVILGSDLAELYEVEPRALTQAVKRNMDRFPDDFMFQLTWAELSRLKSQIMPSSDLSPVISRSQIVIMKKGSNIKYLPYAFTEEGVAMLSSGFFDQFAIPCSLGKDFPGNEARPRALTGCGPRPLAKPARCPSEY